MWRRFAIFFSQQIWHIYAFWVVHLAKLQTSSTGQPGDELVAETTFNLKFTGEEF